MGDYNFRSRWTVSNSSNFINKGQYLFEEIKKADEFKFYDMKDRLRNFLVEKHFLSEANEFPFEGEITFPPTYKFLSQSVYALTQTRSPSFTDRVFFLKNEHNEGELQCLFYGCSYKTNRSDHKPVYAQFLLKGWYEHKEELKKQKELSKLV